MPLDVRVGDIVLFSKYGGTEIVIDGEELLILSARDLVAVMSSIADDGSLRSSDALLMDPHGDDSGDLAWLATERRSTWTPVTVKPRFDW
jgi:hypothetical protein